MPITCTCRPSSASSARVADDGFSFNNLGPVAVTGSAQGNRQTLEYADFDLRGDVNIEIFAEDVDRDQIDTAIAGVVIIEALEEDIHIPASVSGSDADEAGFVFTLMNNGVVEELDDIEDVIVATDVDTKDDHYVIEAGSVAEFLIQFVGDDG